MFAWGSSRQQPGGLYRIRYTGEPLHAPIDMTAVQGGVRLRFPAPLDATSASRPENYTVKVWSLKRTKNYGSKHHNEHLLPVSAARLQNGGRIIHLAVPDLEPTQCIAIHYKVHGDDNEPLDGVIHGTIHELPNAPENSTPESQNDQS